MGGLVVFQHDFHGQYLPHGKDKKLFLRVLKEEVVYVRVHSHGIARKKYYGAITKRMIFNFPLR